MKKQAIIAYTAAAATAATAILGTVGVFAYKASVHNQNCLSYEGQLSRSLNTSGKLLDEMRNMVITVKANPFAAFAYVGRVSSIQTEVVAMASKVNDTAYAYRKTCGAERHAKWVDTNLTLFKSYEDKHAALTALGAS